VTGDVSNTGDESVCVCVFTSLVCSPFQNVCQQNIFISRLGDCPSAVGCTVPSLRQDTVSTSFILFKGHGSAYPACLFDPGLNWRLNVNQLSILVSQAFWNRQGSL